MTTFYLSKLLDTGIHYSIGYKGINSFVVWKDMMQHAPSRSRCEYLLEPLLSTSKMMLLCRWNRLRTITTYWVKSTTIYIATVSPPPYQVSKYLPFVISDCVISPPSFVCYWGRSITRKTDWSVYLSWKIESHSHIDPPHIGSQNTLHYLSQDEGHFVNEIEHNAAPDLLQWFIH